MSLRSHPVFFKALAGLGALAVAMGIGRFAFTPVLPMMIADAGLDIRSGGLLASSNYLGYLLGALSATFFRLPVTRAIRFGLLFTGLLTIAMAAEFPFTVWAVLRFLAGVCSAWVLISVSSWNIDNLQDAQRPWLGNLVFVGVGSGVTGAGLLCLALVHWHAHSSVAWLVLGLLALAITALAWRQFEVPAKAENLTHKSASPHTFRWNAEAVRMVICYGAYGFGYILPATFLPVMAKAALNGSPVFGWSWVVFGLAAIASVWLAAPAVRWLGARKSWVMYHWVMGIGVALPAIHANLLTILIAALCVGGTFIVVTVVAVQDAKRLTRGDATQLIAAMTSAFALGQVVGPFTVRGGADSFEWPLLLAATILIGSGALLLKKID
ncbi:MAG TPA: YbfB/YjiJ family MFS transporter [Limnobacter sp.]|uniref:YbfB/YjiJ family MFS transporter n=1 Tax=Limnobacter sp. TaxID=2003368 RepID=UPI002E339060|nr:YbfB/YjiJ family MFS transporter [Limnobacter sp.]HEX5485411.1 YbfB/YjiJ family MFS transporter [Limnobacter sp.]